jgi:cytochrome c
MEGIFLDHGKRWVERAIAFYEATGKTITLAEFSNPRGPFVVGERYIYVLDIDGTMLAHPINEKYMGQDFYGVQDAEGKSFIKDIVDGANAKGYGWVSYKWFDPVTKIEQNKMVYFEKVDNMIFCSGAYRGNEIYGPSNGHESKMPSAKPLRKSSLRSLIQRFISI